MNNSKITDKILCYVIKYQNLSGNICQKIKKKILDVFLWSVETNSLAYFYSSMTLLVVVFPLNIKEKKQQQQKRIY